jgi:hypothetical protein
MKKEARGYPESPKFVAEQIRDIIDVMIGRMSVDAQQRAYPNLRARIRKLPVTEIASKKNPGGASIGVSIGLVKNILNGRDPIFIQMVINELGKVL